MDAEFTGAKPAHKWWVAAVLVVIVIVMSLRPGLAPWFFDMSRIMDLALQDNATPLHVLGIHLPLTPALYGLRGTHEIHYGPLPVWIDQAFLLFTRDPITMTGIRTVIVASLTALALFWLARRMNVTPWLAVVTMFSPWIWYYSRQLWDNSLAIAPGAIMLAAYADFLIRRRAFSLCIVIICADVMCLIHLMAIPFILPIFAHLLILERKWVIKFKWQLLIVTAVVLLISLPYLQYLTMFRGTKIPDSASAWRGWVFALLGAQHITAGNVGYILQEGDGNISYFLGENWRQIYPSILRYPFVFAGLVTYIGFIACWAGMAIAIPRARKVLRQRETAGPLDHLCLIGWAIFVLQTLFDGIEHVSKHPHYYNCTWITYVMFAWIALDAIPRRLGPKNMIGRLIIPVYAASLLFVTTVVAIQIVHNGGTRGDHYDAVLSNQMKVAKEVEKFSDTSSMDFRITYWARRQETPKVLFKLVEPGAGDRPTRSLVIRFVGKAPDARIIVEEQ